MTISTTTIKNSFSGDGSTTAFTYTFPINTTSEISVIERSALGIETIKAEGTGSTNYGIADNGAAGGTVTMVTAPADGTTLILRRNTDLTQETDYVANDPFPAETHEDALDKLQMQNQELQEQADRSFKVSRSNTITSSEFTDSAADRASKTLGFNSDGNLTTVADFLPAGGDSAQFTYSTTTTDADPGSGFIRFNNATIASATIAYIDDAEANGTDVSAWVQSFDDVVANPTNRGRIRVSKANTLDTWHVFKVNAAVTDASGYTKIPLTYIDGAGTIANNDKVFVSFVSSGEDGVSPGYFYKFATSTTDGDPGAGILRFDDSTYADVTEIYIDDADQHGGATNADTLTWGSSTAGHKGFIQIVDVNDKATYVKFKVTGTSTDASGYNKLTVVHVTSNNTFSADDELSVHFTASGNDGAIPGYEYTFDTNTADSDPGAGDVKFNNATYASVTRIYIDDADANGVTTQADTLTWGASDSVIKGFIHISDTNDHSTYARFKVTAAVTDASGYNTITVVHLASNNTFSASDNLSVHFTRNGDFGDAATIEVNNVTVSTVSAGGSATATVANAGSTAEASLNFAFGIPTGATGATGADGDVTAAGVATLTNKTLTAPKINEDVAVTSTATEINLLDGKAATNLALVGKTEGTNFTNSLLVGHATTGTLNAAENNTGVGIGALDAITSGDKNTAIGTNAGTDLNSGSFNTLNGYGSGENITTGSENTAIGTNALGNVLTGSNNTALGSAALNAATGSYNTALGYQAARLIEGGAYNIAIGNASGDNITSGNGNVIIGSINADSATGNRQLKIADGTDGSVNWITGDIDSNVTIGGTLTSNTGLVKTVGKESIWVPSNAMTPTTTNGAERASVETTATRPDMQVLDFDKDADEYAQFSIAFPKSWNLGTVTFQAFWSGIAATTDVDWGVQAVAMNDNQTIDVAFGTAVVVTDNAQGAVEELLVSAESGAITIAGTPADNDLTYFQIYRDVSGDAMAGDARLHGVKIFYTTDAANDA